MRALQILFTEHRTQGQLFVLRISACKDVFSAPELRDCLPGLKNNEYLKKKFRKEFLIRGKVEEHAIIGCVTCRDLQCCDLDLIAPGYSKLWSWKQKKPWVEEFERSRASYLDASDELLDAAIALPFQFNLEDRLAIVNNFVGPEFRIHFEGINEGLVLTKIKKRLYTAMVGALKDLHRAAKEFIQALGVSIEALEQ